MELYRNGLKLIVTKGLDESRGSVNVPVKLSHNEKDEYLNYTEQIHIRYLFDNQVKEEILPTKDNGFYIPGKAFVESGPVQLAVHLINGDVERVTNELQFVVKKAPNGKTLVDPSEFSWQQLVDQYVNAKLDTFANKLDLSKFEEKVNGSIENQNQNIESFKTEVNANLSQTNSIQNSKITTLEGRMDTFTSLKEGSTTGDAELQDIRVGSDGTKYTSAGKAVREQVGKLKEDLTHYIYKPTLEDNNKFPRAKDGNVEWVEQGMPTDEQTSNAINNWLNAHPEATTTVLDESLTESKFTNDLKLHTLKDYITPQMFGAKGDGITDDTKAFQKCFAANRKIIIPKGNYLVGQCEVTNSCLIEMYDGAYITLKDEYFIHTSEGTITIKGGSFYGTAKASESRYYAKKVITGKLFDIKITNTRFYRCIALYQTEGNYSGFIHCNNMWVYDSQFIISTKTLNFVSCVGCVIQNASNIIEASNYENISLVNCSIEHVINLFSPSYDGVSYNGISITNCYIEYSSLFTTGKCISIEVRNSWIYTNVTLIALNSGPGYCVISNNSITLLNETKLINNTNISTLLEFGVGSIKYNNGTIDRNNVNNIYSGTCFVKVLNQETLYMNPTCDTLLFTGKQDTTIKKSISVNGEEDKIYYRPETSGLKASTFIPYILKLGKSDLLSITPPQDCFAIELTTKILYIYDGTNWRKTSDGSILE